MPVITINSEKKKVACGPCIRGHRSSKCTHKDRVLIEVRKPGRPLGTCPHPGGNCGCERIVVNYCLPKSGNSSASTTPSDFSFTNPAKIQKARPQRQISNLPHSTVKDIIQGNAKGLAKLANIPQDMTTSSDQNSTSSSKTDSAPSSKSSTPVITTESIMAAQGQAPEQPGLFAKWMDYYPVPPTDMQNQKQQEEDTEAEKSCCCSTPVTQPPPRENPPNVPQGQVFSSQISQMSSPFGFSDFDTDFDSYEFTPGCPMPQIHQNGLSEERSCECGDSCTCFACTEHPHNRTTVDYVRYHSSIATTPQFLPGPSMTQQQAQMLQFSQANQFPNMNMHPIAQGYVPPHTQPFTSPPAYELGGMSWPSAPVPHIHMPHQQPMGFTQQTEMVPPAHIHSANPFSAPSHPHAFHPIPLLDPAAQNQNHQSLTSKQAKQESPSIISQDSTAAPGFSTDGESVTDEDSTLSPSSFMLQQFTLNCDNENGLCKCEEGCSCSGCLTHRGHSLNDDNDILS